jgi:5'-3' exonuclease
VRIPCLRERAYEADDVIATIVHQAHEQPCVVMSADHDFYQGLSDRISLLNTARQADRRRIHPADVYGRHGVYPYQWCHHRA